MSIHRIHADICLGNIRDNFNNICGRLPAHVKRLAVIKADAYGHGSVEVARSLADDADFFAVATAEEAVKLRREGISVPILILGYVWPEDYCTLISEEVRFPVFKYEDAQLISSFASIMKKKALVHIKVDTGMGRIGFGTGDDDVERVRQIRRLPYLDCEGIFTHFARADELDKRYTLEQYERFASFVSRVEEGDEPFAIHHCCNSAAAMELPDLAMDMVRIGIALYGLYPSDEVVRDIALKPALSLKSEIVYIKRLEKGAGISYNHTEFLERDSLVATVPAGYADGYPRRLSCKADVLIRGRRARILGRICMDQMMVDVTDIPDVCEGDTVTLIGRDGDEFIPVEELSEICGRFNYELICEISPRTPRIYY